MVRRTYFQSDFEAALRSRLDSLQQEDPEAERIEGPPRVSLHSPLNQPRSTTGPRQADATTVDIESTRLHRVSTPQGDLWIRGNTLLCACPTCNAPMTIRVWLELADCWRCPTSIELSAEQLAAVQQLLGTAPAPPIAAPHVPFDQWIDPPDDSDLTPPLEPVLESGIDHRREELDRLTQSNTAAQILRHGFSAVPAWLVSFLFHLIAILLLVGNIVLLGSKM